MINVNVNVSCLIDEKIIYSCRYLVFFFRCLIELGVYIKSCEW